MEKDKPISVGQILIVILLLTALCEIFLANGSFWMTFDNVKISLDLSQAVLSESGKQIDSGEIYFFDTGGINAAVFILDGVYPGGMSPDNIGIRIRTIDGEATWYDSIGEIPYVTLQNEAVDVTVSVFSGGVWKTTDRGRLGTADGKMQYLDLGEYRDVQAVRLDVQGVLGSNILIDEIVFDANKPFRISMVRMFYEFITFGLIASLRPVSELWRAEAELKKQHRTVMMAAIAGFFVLCLWMYMQNPPYVEGNGGFCPYEKLAKALAQGHTYVDTEVDPTLLSMEDPYDPYARYVQGVRFLQDYAYFDGHYYVYFGIIPCLVFYLPRYLITGGTMSNVVVLFILSVLSMTGILFLIREWEYRWEMKLSASSWVISFLLWVCAFMLPSCMGDSNFYYIPMYSAIVCFLWGIVLTYNGIRKDRLWMLAIGSLLLAMIAGCRPHLVLLAAITLPAVYKYVMKRDKKIMAIVSWGLPYVAVAIPLMIYNQVRFGSVVNFGAQYNLTAYNGTAQVYTAERLYDGLRYYLVGWTNWRIGFPFLTQKYLSLRTDLVQEPTCGGIFTSLPILLLAFYPVLRKRKNIDAEVEEASGNKEWIREMRWNRILLWILAVFYWGVVSELGELIDRYKMDITPLLGILSIQSLFVLEHDWRKWSDKWVRIVKDAIIIFLAISLAYAFLQYYQKGVWSLYDSNPNLYSRARELMQWW